MANRVLMGNRSTGGYGLYVGKDGEDVLTTTNSLLFDARMAGSLIVHSYGQGSLAGDSTADITHSLGYNPTFAVRWSHAADLDGSNIATKVYTPNWAQSVVIEAEEGEEEETEQKEDAWGLTATHLNTTTLRITNHNNNDYSGTKLTYYYAYLIFHEADFTGGHGL